MKTRFALTIALLLLLLATSACSFTLGVAPTATLVPTSMPTTTLVPTSMPTTTPTALLPVVAAYRCADPKSVSVDPAPEDNNGKACAQLDGPIMVLGVDLTITKVFTASSFKTGSFTLTPPEDEILIIVQATSQHGAMTITDWPEGSVYLDFLFPNGSIANNPIPYDVQAVPDTEGPGQVEWVFGIGKSLLRENPLVLVLPDGVVVPLAPLGLK